MKYNVISLTRLLFWRWEGREKTQVAGLVFILNIHENTNERIPAVNSAFWLMEWMFLKPTCNKIFSEISMWDSLFWLGRTANSVVFVDFALMHSRASRHLLRVFGRARKAGSYKNLASKIQNVCGIFITEKDPLSTLIFSKCVGLVSRASQFRQRG